MIGVVIRGCKYLYGKPLKADLEETDKHHEDAKESVETTNLRTFTPVGSREELDSASDKPSSAVACSGYHDRGTTWIRRESQGQYFETSMLIPAHIPKKILTQAVHEQVPTASQRHFARECRFAKYQENRANGRNEKRIVAIEDSNSKALVATDNNEDIDWTKEFDAEPVTYAMMALTGLMLHQYSLALMANNKPSGGGRTEILGYQMSLESLEVMLKTHEKNEYAWGDKYEQMEYDLKIRDLKLEEKQKELDQALKERDDFKVKLEKWDSDLAIRNKVVDQEKTKSSQSAIDRNKVIIEDWVDSDDEETDVSESQKETVFNSENSETSFENRSPNSQNSVGQESRTKGLGNKGGTARSRVPQAVLSRSTDGSYYPRLDNRRPRISSYSPSSRSSTTRTPHRPQRPKKIVKSIWVKKGSTVGSQAVLPQTDYAIIDSGCSGSMTGDKDKLSDFKEFKGGYVAFGNDSKGGRISGKGTIKTSCLDFEKVSYVEELKFNLLSVSQICDKKHNLSRQNDGYRLDLKIIIPSGGIICFVAKATEDEAVTMATEDGACQLQKYQQVGLRHLENQKGKGPDWMFDLDLLTPSMNYIPVREENYADSKEQGISCDDVEDLDDQQFIVHTAQPMHPEERTAAKEVSLSSEEQALHDELVSLMHQESLAKAHNDDQRIAFEEEKRRISIAKGKEHVDSTFTLSGVADYNNMDPTIDVPSTPTLRIHKIHPQSQIIGKSTAGVQTRRKLQDKEPKKVSQALADKSWVEAMQEDNSSNLSYKMLFLAFASFHGPFPVYQMDVKSAFFVWQHTEEACNSSPKSMVMKDSPFSFEAWDIGEDPQESSMVKDFEDLMQKEFKMSSMGELTFFLGLQVKQSNGDSPTPIEALKSLGYKMDEGEDVDVHLYRFQYSKLFRIGDYAGDNHDKKIYVRRMSVSWE
ncbi:hypothetical protein Tco_0090985 [Tanacetum coccineum]